MSCICQVFGPREAGRQTSGNERPPCSDRVLDFDKAMDLSPKYVASRVKWGYNRIIYQSK